MKLAAPADYGDFHCLAGQCRHTCCAGWEIAVDPDTAARYRRIPGAFGDRLRAGMTADGFRLGEDGRCPFLNGENLCEIILNLGEDALCQVCRDHPRYRNFWSDRVEIGLGLCCEAAVDQLFRRREPLRMAVLADDGAETPPPTREEQALLQLRDSLLRILQDRSRPLSARLADWRRALGLKRTGPGAWAEGLLELEPLDPAWPALLRRIRPRACRPWAPADEQICAALLYRELPGALTEGRVLGRAAFPLRAAELLRHLPGDPRENLRLFSAEIEYSRENLDAALAMLEA